MPCHAIRKPHSASLSSQSRLFPRNRVLASLAGQVRCAGGKGGGGVQGRGRASGAVEKDWACGLLQTDINQELIQNKFIVMKLRTPRIHLMGASNRDLDTFGNQAKNVFEKSYIKSKSSYYKTTNSLLQVEDKEPKTKNPYQGTHFEQDSLRWNSKAKKTGSDTEWKLHQAVKQLDYSGLLNRDVSNLAEEFKGKDINMFKLDQLKQTFIKNNRKRRNLNGYFESIAKEGKVGVSEMKKIVREYGYDITDDEARIIFKLTGAKEQHLGIDKFVDLMTKENIHFKTLKIDGAFGKPRKHFEEKIHLVFKNKFNQLREAFKIYRMRGEEIDEDKYHYVMKKLDINDLVVSREERQDLFDKFSEEGSEKKVFNVERLLCAIVEQQYTLKPTYPPKLSNYDDNLMVNEEKQAKNRKKNTYFDFKRLSNLQYENQLFKAQQVLNQLKKFPQANAEIFSNGDKISREKVREKVQAALQKKGINFLKDEYDCFISYLDFNTNNEISSSQFKEFLQQPAKKAQERFQRRVRALPPQNGKAEQGIYDQGTALNCLERVKSKKNNPEMRVLFKEFDSDKDGYISREQFKQKISNLAVLEHWEVQNLANYFDASGKGYVQFKDFAEKFTKGDREPQNVTESHIKAKSQSQWITTKRSTIKETNSYSINVPSKYSAWPQRLKRIDFSMIQPPNKAGQFISEDSRFNTSEKHSLGQQLKQQKYRIYENKLRRLANWNELNHQRVQNKETQSEQRSQANDYLMRLTKETYEQHCHK